MHLNHLYLIKFFDYFPLTEQPETSNRYEVLLFNKIHTNLPLVGRCIRCSLHCRCFTAVCISTSIWLGSFCHLTKPNPALILRWQKLQHMNKLNWYRKNLKHRSCKHIMESVKRILWKSSRETRLPPRAEPKGGPCPPLTDAIRMHKVSEPNLATYLNRASIFEWWMIRCRSQNRYQKDIYLKEIGLRAQNLLAT